MKVCVCVCQARSKQSLFGQAMISTFSGVCTLHTHLSRGIWGHDPPGFFLKSTPLKTYLWGFLRNLISEYFVRKNK